MKTKISFLMLPLAALLLWAGCKKKFDNPPFKPVNDGAVMSIAQLKSKLQSAPMYKFVGDTNLYCTVTADESSGNIFKQLFVQDDNGGAIQLNLVNPGGLYVGDRIRINLNNIYLVNANSMIYLDSVDIEKSVVKLSSGSVVTPTVVTLQDIIYLTDPLNATSLQSRLIQINNVEFIPNVDNPTYANAISKQAINQTVQDCAGRNIIVRSSGYANFAGKRLPEGNGSIIAVLTQYNDAMQLTIRGYNEVNMKGTRCSDVVVPGLFLSKNFDDNSAVSGNWSMQNVVGSINWVTSKAGGAPNPYCQCSNYSGGSNQACESWLISPPLDLSTSTEPVLNFKNAFKYNGDPLQVMVSKTYSGSGDPNAAQWESLPFNASPGDFIFVNSDDVALSNYKAANVYVAFRYTGSGTSGSTWEIDDVMVKEKAGN